MSQAVFCHPGISKVAVVGNFLPRQCGIATFTTDLVCALTEESPELDHWVVAMNDVLEGYRYPSPVHFELNYQNPTDYILAADFLNMNHFDVVCLQHEFGIFGGQYGSHIINLLQNLCMPVVTTLHTVLEEPAPGQKAVMERIAQFSDRLVVMCGKAKEILHKVYGIHKAKIALIHHGIPDVHFVDSNFYKDKFGVEGCKVILSFGLISPAKGIEYMLDAMPEVIKKHPDVVYIILGATHPHLKKEQGEAYRLALQRQTRELNVEKHVIFQNRFVEQRELLEFIGAADIYVTPYLSKEQIVSGTLSQALGAGKAIVSTPYWYAEEMLADGRGRIVPFRDSAALAAQLIELLDDDVVRHAMRKRAYTFCRNMIWKEAARSYLDVFTQVKNERQLNPNRMFYAKTSQFISHEMPQLKLDHLRRLTDDVGILQHAKFIIPNRFHGYCTDDNARALIVALMAQSLLPDSDELDSMACRYLSFLHHAINKDNGRFRNFMGYDRRWIEDEGSQDSHGRAVWALGSAVALSKSDSIVGMAMELFQRSLPALVELESPRAWAFGLVGIHAYLQRYSGDSDVRRVREKLANRLFALYEANASPEWPWIEEKMAYANGKIPQALLLSGQWLQREYMIQAGLCSLEWLVKVQTDDRGHFVPIGNHGWMSRDGHRARFDQQPIEAENMIEACKEAYNVTLDKKWISESQRCLEWFLGRNDLNAALYDYKSGGCCDGLNGNGANLNQGAESTLAWLLSLLHSYSLVSLKEWAQPEDKLKPKATKD